MSSQAIGSLFVSLGLDSAAFQAGIKQVQTQTQKITERLNKIGDGAVAMGKKLSVVTGAMAAVGGAGIALAKKTADAGAEVARQAQVANASAEEFQRWAAGSKTVGIEQDKLADILKDVNDRVGDFVQTGGGPMADFFENIGPKVGVTAEHFKNLSGPEALQLYVSSLERAGVSQQDMTFYMEAMASDATALIPLLQNGGAAMSAYGDAAAKTGAIMSGNAIAASLEFQEKLRTLMMSLEGVRNRLGEQLLPILNRFMDTLITVGVPALQKLVGHIEDAIQWFGALPGPVQEAAAVIAGAFAAGGPILIGIGLVSKALGALIAATGPVGLFIAAASLLVAAWQIWGDDIKRIVGDAAAWIGQKADEIVAWFGAIPERLREVGQQLVDGLIAGITERWDVLKSKVTGMADNVTGWFKDKLDIHSPSRVFQAIGRFITDGLGIGIMEGVPGVKTAMDGVLDVAGADGKLTQGMFKFRDTARNVFAQVALEGAKLGDVLKGLASSWLSNTANGLFSAGFNGLWSTIGLPGFAAGTPHFAGGLARINERGEEIVNLPSGSKVIPAGLSQRMADGMGGAAALSVTMANGIDGQGNLITIIRDQAGRVLAENRQSLITQSVQATARASRSSKRVMGL